MSGAELAPTSNVGLDTGFDRAFGFDVDGVFAFDVDGAFAFAFDGAFAFAFDLDGAFALVVFDFDAVLVTRTIG